MTKPVLKPIHLGFLCAGCILGVSDLGQGVYAQTTGTAVAPANSNASATAKTFVSRLRGIVLVPSRDKVVPDGIRDVSGIEIREVPMLADARIRERLTAHLQPFLEKSPFTDRDLTNLLKEIVAFCRDNTDALVFDVAVYDHDAPEVLQVAVLEAKVGAVIVKNPEPKWISDAKVLSRLGLKEGEPISKEKMKEGLELFAEDGFNDVQPLLTAGNKLGTTDATVEVNDRLPMSASVGYQNYGSQLVGEHQLYARASFGNLFGAAHKLSYQFTGDVDLAFLRAHAASYVAPLPWGHKIVAYGGYADVRSDTSKLVVTGQSPDYNGKAYGAGFQYSVPLPKSRSLRHEVWLGGDYKYANTSTLFGGGQVGIDIPFDMVSFSAGYRLEATDGLGASRFELHATYGPGDWTAHSSEADYSRVRESDPQFFYLSGSVDRFLRIVKRDTVHFGKSNSDRDDDYLGLNFRVAGTWSDDRLPPSETFRLGGYDTVRGYDMALVAADKGYVFRTELRLPWIQLPFGRKQASAAEIGLYGFLDHGYAVFNDYSRASDGSSPSYHLTSSGAGFRFRLGRHLSARFEYGVVISEDAEEIVRNLPTTIRDASLAAKAHGMIELTF